MANNSIAVLKQIEEQLEALNSKFSEYKESKDAERRNALDRKMNLTILGASLIAVAFGAAQLVAVPAFAQSSVTLAIVFSLFWLSGLIVIGIVLFWSLTNELSLWLDRWRGA